jgi:hypothetical protein
MAMAMNQSKARAFDDLPDMEQKEFVSKLMYAIKRSDTCYYIAFNIISLAEQLGLFKNVKTGVEEVFKKH